MIRTLVAAVKLTRPPQWVKNVFVFGALVFAGRLGDVDAMLHSIVAFAIFCGLSGAVYAFNDLLDHREDALHPTKKNRPVASGAISPGLAGVLAVLLAAGGTFASLQMPQGFALTAVSYLILNLFYSLWGKRRVLLDVILIAIGFVLRALAGAEAIGVEVSAWLVICTFTLCLFLGFGKRRCEIATLGGKSAATSHRATLASYTPDLLTQLLSTTGGLAVVTFLLYTLDPNTPTPNSLVFTTPLVFYAVFRYAMIIGQGERTGPTDVLINDRPFLITAILWVAVTVYLISPYGRALEKHLPQMRYPGFPAATQPAP